MDNCLICSSDTYVLDDKQFNIIYHRCKSCDFIYMDRESVVSFKEERKVYELHNNSIEDEGYVAMFNRFINSFVEDVDGKELLEYGSGPEPVFSELMKRRGFNVTMYDLHYYNDDSYLNNKYDVITSTEVFEHFLDPMKELEKLIPLLNAGGVLAIMTQFPKGDEHFLDWWYRRDETHISFFTEKSFSYIANHFNLEIIFTNHKDYMILKKI